ncbi:hypothetical protein HGP16_14990 [Rhizobium sp. P40RR-XXII]|nr:hypothetical protein [Rhizobium sp. P40RR-XXII]NLS17867.1 hypothetical protein [Rhizobium sp. P40RR-XXII]
MDIDGSKALVAVLLGGMLAACSTTNGAPEQQATKKPAGPTAIEPAVAAFRDICFAYRPPYTQARAAAARYGVKTFETKQGSSLISGKYTYLEGATDDRSLIVIINPDGLCDTKYRRHPGMADDETIERQFADVIRTKYPDAFKIGDRGHEYHVSINGKRTSFGFSLNHDGYIQFMSP